MKTRLLLGFLGLFFILTVSGAQADLIYNNGLPNGAFGNEMTARIQAEDFTLASPQTVTGVRFWAFTQHDPAFLDSDFLGYQGSIVWQIYQDNGGKPGDLVISGSAVPTMATGPYQNSADIGPDYQFDFSIIPSQALPAGTYWLGLHNGPLSISNNYASIDTFIDSSDFYWETTNIPIPNGTSTGHEDLSPFAGAWDDNGYEHAFQLYGNAVPLPGAIWLLGSGLVGLAGWRRFRKS